VSLNLELPKSNEFFPNPKAYLVSAKGYTLRNGYLSSASAAVMVGRLPLRKWGDLEMPIMEPAQ